MVDSATFITARRASNGDVATVRALAHPEAGNALMPVSAIGAEQWRALAERVIEPNAYYLPPWTIAVNGSARRMARTSLLAARNADDELTGLVPVISAWSAYRLPLPALVSADPFRSLDTPLFAANAPVEAAAALIEQARKSGAHALILRLVPLQGPAMQAFRQALRLQRLQARVLQSYSRAFLDATQDADTMLRDALGGKKLKDLRRLRSRLAEHGEVTFNVASSARDVGQAFDVFLTLEASGWKGRARTAIGQQPEDAARMRNAIVELAMCGQCEVVTLKAGLTPVAAGIVLRHHRRAFFFKIGIDEALAKFSPGVQLTLDLTRHLCADPHILEADSTASADHPMINRIWRGRLDIGDVVVPLYRNDPMVPTIYWALRTHALARVAALKLLRR